MENSSTPLADYFWIAGIESIKYDDAPLVKEHPVESTIAEDKEPNDGDTSAATNGQSNRGTARHSRQNSGNRFSRLSFDNRFSLQTLDDFDAGNTSSNRSSATIRPVNNLDGTNGTSTEGNTGASGGGGGLGLLGDVDFDNALLKFAAEREDFLDDLTFSAGAKIQSRPPMVNPRMDRIKAEEGDASGRKSPLRNLGGSIRRKMSLREMHSLRKQPSSARQPAGTTRACKFPPQAHHQRLNEKRWSESHD
jgi:hypothetical protein